MTASALPALAIASDVGQASAGFDEVTRCVAATALSLSRMADELRVKVLEFKLS